ncbi:MAG: peptidoglycan-binding protein, partial [Candidatus Omnitrophica bacterium]|nr:peptidoglycan-binding protein [Candidatus Omnitrophota bacterium]
EAIREFQRVHGLNEDGVVGKQTWAKLSAYEDLSASSGEATAAEVLK